MRLPVAIDRFLRQMQVENDWTPRTIDSVYRTLVKLADEHPEAQLSEFSGRAGTEILRDHVGRLYGRLSASTRATRISYFRTFWAWAEEEGYVDDDPARRLRRPPKRRADVYRPGPAELDLVERACDARELAAFALMRWRGFRASTVVAVRWRDIDLARARIRIVVKGGHRDWAPLGPRATALLQRTYRSLEPDPDDHVFTVEEERWIDRDHRVRAVRDAKEPATTKALWRMVRRVCKRAGVRPLGPHALRHGFATDFLRAGGSRDELKGLLGHSRIDTTEHYTDELKREELDDALQRVEDARSQATESDATTVAEEGDGDANPGEDRLNPAYGGGGNRTRVREATTEEGDRPRTPEDDDDRLEPPDRRH